MEIIAKLPEWAHLALVIMGALTVLGTAIARLTPSKKDDDIMLKVESAWAKMTMWLPTMGVNPSTKEMKKALAEVKSEMPAKPEAKSVKK